MARSVNKVILIGNLTRDPELRYTPQGHAVCSFGIATNREWTVEGGEKKESTEFHNIVAWNKLAELCAQLLHKGTKTYVEGRLQTRDWVNDSGEKRYKTEVVIEEMIILSSKRSGDYDAPSHTDSDKKAGSADFDAGSADEVVASDDIPF
jgi:single-strand DNA-binding protein